MYVFDAPESAFRTSEQVEVTTLDDKLFSKHLTKLFFILLTCVAPRKNYKQFVLLPFILFLNVASILWPFFIWAVFTPMRATTTRPAVAFPRLSCFWINIIHRSCIFLIRDFGRVRFFIRHATQLCLHC